MVTATNTPSHRRTTCLDSDRSLRVEVMPANPTAAVSTSLTGTSATWPGECKWWARTETLD